MPRRKKNRKKGKTGLRKNITRPVGRYGHKGGKAYKVLPRYQNLMPNNFPTKLVFSYTEDNTIAGGIDTYQFRGNSVYDPDYEAGGTQPAGYDELSQIYTNYCVSSAIFQISVQSLDTVPTFVGVHAQYASATVPANIEDFMQNPNSRYMWVAPQGSSGDRKTLKFFMSSKKILNCKDLMDERNFTSDVSTNPTNQWYFLCRLQNTDAGNMALFNVIKITYYVTFFDRSILVDA